MKRIAGHQLAQIIPYFEQAATVARNAKCRQSKCGSVIVYDGQIIGSGYNGPPLDDESRRTCGAVLDRSKKPKYDLTCCIHAEWRAILDGLIKHPTKMKGSCLYFMRVDDEGKFTDAGQPYCTTCSRLAMEAGIAQFALWNKNGADVYNLPEYDRLSYEFHRP